jgi:hypothetical protein
MHYTQMIYSSTTVKDNQNNGGRIVYKDCTGNVHVNHADDRHPYISLNELAFFNVITVTVYVYVTPLSEAVMLLIIEKYSF